MIIIAWFDVNLCIRLQQNFAKNRDFWYFYGNNYTNEMSQNYFSRSFRDILSVMESNNLNLSAVFTKVNVGKKKKSE